MRRFRFGVVFGRQGAGSGGEGWREAARAAEDLGYDVLLAPDHLGSGAGSPLLQLAAAAQVTSAIRLGTLVLNNDFYNPLLLARDAAVLDRVSGGRLELGLGAGYARAEYEAAGLDYRRGAVRLERLAESVAVLDAALRGEAVEHRGRWHRVVSEPLMDAPVQRPRLPLLVAGDGPGVLALAARRADIVGLNGLRARGGWIAPAGLSAAAAAERVALIEAEAGARSGDLELQALVQRVELTGDRRAVAEEIAGGLEGVRPEDVLDSPYTLLGSEEAVVEALERHRERLGISYVAVFEPAMRTFAPVVARLAGT